MVFNSIVNTATATAGMRITADEADALLTKDLVTFERQVNHMVTAPIQQHQFDALMSFAYNVGTGSLRGSTLLKRVNAVEYVSAEFEFDRWVRSKGKVLPGLVRRRAAERAMFAGKPGNTWENEGGTPT